MPAVAVLLGRAGLVPFCVTPLAIWLWPRYAPAFCEALAVYALGIVCFLTGAWWGIGLIRRATAGLVLSNALFVAVVAGKLTLPLPLFLLFAALMLVITVLFERRLPLFRPAPHYYRAMRLQLTAVAGAALVLAAAQLARF